MKAIFIFNEICAYLNIQKNIHNHVDVAKIAAKPKNAYQSFHTILSLLPDVGKCMDLITKLEWDPEISFTLVKT